MSTVIPLSMKNEPYISHYDYPPGYIQGGTSGIVFTPTGNYRTAFIEFFPEAGEIGIIRGEGETLEAADENLWTKLQLILSDHEHSYDPRKYKNGGGFCVTCNGFNGSAFTAEELGQFCKECSSPVLAGKTGVALKDGTFLCTEHDPLESYKELYYSLMELEDWSEDEELLGRISEVKRIVYYDAEPNPELLDYFVPHLKSFEEFGTPEYKKYKKFQKAFAEANPEV